MALGILSAVRAAVAAEPDEPVIFWAHYMPMVPHGHLHAHPHAGGNHDAWPLDSQHADLKDDYKEDMRQALESGVNGFQMLAFVPDEALAAAREIREETGRTFYVAPQWLGSRSFDAEVKEIEAFAARHGGDPAVYRRDGRPVHFFWNAGADRIALLRERLAKDGVPALLVPNFYLKQIVDDPALFSESPEAVQMWTHGASSAEIVDGIVRRLPQGRFFFVPGVASGYDSSNRTGQAIHVPANGLSTLLDSLRLWVGRGFRQLMLVTWNDPQESLEIPSSRNLWGHNAVLRYFHGLAETGASPFPETRFVVAYPVECLWGDRLPFQVLSLPGKGGAPAWRAWVRLVPFGAGSRIPAAELAGEAKAGDRETLLELSAAPAGFLDGVAALQPRVTIERKASADGAWLPVYRDLPLPPVTLRYNLVQYPVGYSIDLARIDGDAALSLSAGGGAPLSPCAVDLDAKGDPVRRLVLCEGTRSLGAFRPPASGSADRNLYVKVEASDDVPLALSLSKGTVHDLYSPYSKLGEAVRAVEAPSAVFPARPPGGEYRARVARIEAPADAVVTLRASSSPEADALSVPLADLARGMAVRTVDLGGGKLTLRMVLTSDATDPNVDFPLGAATRIARDVPLHLDREGERVLSAWAWHESGRVGVSAPVVVGRGDPADTVPIQWIETGGAFDAFVDGASEISRNPFSAADVRNGVLARSRVPYFHLALDEGAGPRLNDRGTSQQPGRAYLEFGPLKREQGEDEESGGHYRWLENGRFGRALQLNEGAHIRFRSKSAPAAAETVSLWVDVRPQADGKDGGPAPAWKRLQADPFSLSLQADGTVAVRFARGGAVAEAAFPARLKEGWNHLAFVYDLASVRCYANGDEVGAIPGVRPVCQRTHQTPLLGFADPAADGAGFTGKLDDIQVIGAGLDAGAVRRLATGEPWR